YLLMIGFLSLLLRHAPIAALFPYTTLFRSWEREGGGERDREPIACGGEFCPFCPQLFVAGQNSVSRYRGKWLYEARLSLLSPPRSEEHTSELQSRENLVCRLLLEKKKTADP